MRREAADGRDCERNDDEEEEDDDDDEEVCEEDGEVTARFQVGLRCGGERYAGGGMMERLNVLNS